MKSISHYFRIAAASLFACLMAASCLQEETPSENNGGTTTMTVSFRCESPVSTRSSAFSSTVTAIQDVNCYIWDRGVCVAHYYLEGEAQSIHHIISTGGEYTVYALANIGRKMEPAVSGWQKNESSMLDITVGRGEKEWTAFPMAGTAGPVSFSSGHQTVTVSLRRLVARIGFCFSPDALLKGQNIEVTAVRLCNAAADVHPFATESAASSVLSVDDTATQTDLQLLSGNEVAYFYAFENCRGTLLPDNDDPWKKVPENIGSEAALCTYLEVDCKMPGDGIIGGDVTYRFYPGSDNVTNFDVRRNYSYIIKLCATGDGLDRLSWKVDADVNYTNNQLITLRKDRGLHPIDDTYLGEMFSCSLTNIDASVLAYFGGTVADLIKNADLRCIADDGGTDLIEFNGGSESAGSVTRIEGTVLRTGNGSVWLCTRDGNLAVPLLQGVTVNRPKLVLSYDTWANYPECLDEPPVALINAGMKDIHLYLCDQDGLNLMADVADQYFFSDRPYRFSGTLDLGVYKYHLNMDKYLGAYLEYSYLFDGNKDDVVGQPFASFEYGITLSDNESTWDAQNSAVLVDACFDTEPPFSITIEDRDQELSVSTAAALTYQKIEIDYNNDTNEIEFINPSKIPLQIRVYEFTFGDDLREDILPEYGVAYKIPSNVSPALSSTTITPYSAVGYHIPHLYTSPVRTIIVSPDSPSVMVGRDRWLVGKEDLKFKGYELRNLINTHYSSRADPSSTTGIAIDIRACGRHSYYRLGNLGVSASQKYPNKYEGSFCGSAIFSDGQFVYSDIGGCVGYGEACEVNKLHIIYSPSRMITLLDKNAKLTTSYTTGSSSSSGKNTESLAVLLSNAKPTDFTFALSLYGEVTVYPKGTAWSSVTHLVGPDTNSAQAHINSGSSSTNYRCEPGLRTTHSLSIPGYGTYGYPVPLYSLITSNLFSLTETDAYTALNGSNSFQHQYHPINFYMSVNVKAQNIADIYKGTFSDRSYTGSTSEDLKSGCLFTDDYYYWNPDYRWNKIDESSTTWSFRCNKMDLNGIGYVCVVE